jgi:hypothetical protein
MWGTWRKRKHEFHRILRVAAAIRADVGYTHGSEGVLRLTVVVLNSDINSATETLCKY